MARLLTTPADLVTLSPTLRNGLKKGFRGSGACGDQAHHRRCAVFLHVHVDRRNRARCRTRAGLTGPMIGRWKRPQRSVNAEYWRKLAAEARSKADGLTNSRSKQTMMNVAQAYERRAVKAEKELNAGEVSPVGAAY